MEIRIPEGHEQFVMDKLVYKSVVIDDDGDAWQKRVKGWCVAVAPHHGHPRSTDEIVGLAPFTIIHSPGPIPTIPEESVEPTKPPFDPEAVDRAISEFMAGVARASERFAKATATAKDMLEKKR